jgi:putative ABC transport system permease protein
VVAAVRQETGFVIGQPQADGKTVQGFLPVVGLSPELINEFQSFTGELAAEPGGRLIEPGDTTTAVLGRTIAERLNAEVGSSIEIEGIAFEVIGILEQEEEEAGGFARMEISPSRDDIYIPFNTMTQLYGAPDNILITLVRTEEGVDVDEVAARVETLLNASGGSRVETITYSDISDAIGTVTGTISAFLAGIAGISLLVGGVGVMNTMFTSVLERTREIGVMKAVGARNGQILSIFLIESGLMGLVGGAVGVLLGLGLSGVAGIVIRRAFDVNLAIVASPALIIITLLGSFALGAFAGLWPARRAAKLSVVDALRYE